MIEFWRRWHITLSRFLRDYLYIPLGGNRHGEGRRQLNLFATMLLGGLWHGAGWTFVIWGALHGLYLAVNHAWRALPRARRTDRRRTAIGAGASWALTFLAIVVGWVFFRAPSLGAALSMLSAMAGRYGTGWPGTPGEAQDLVLGLALSVGFTVIALAAPNTQEIAGYTGPSGAYDTRVAPPPRREAWDPRPAWGLAAGAVFALCVLSLSRISEFLYFQF
jgi:D-alanyl-lipoteichoic acid acyltransferase DltB (MBOAT superfamily)